MIKFIDLVYADRYMPYLKTSYPFCLANFRQKRRDHKFKNS